MSLVQIRNIEVSTEMPVFVCDLSPVQPILELAKEAIFELQASHPQSPESNVKAKYMSPWHSHLLTTKFNPLTESAINIAKEVSRIHLSANLTGLNIDLVVTDCWGVIYDQSDYTQKHNHFPSDFSCVVYLEADESSAPIIFGGKLHIKPKPSMLVLFPGMLVHEVPKTDGRRVVVAMNINKKAMFDNVKT
jgi:hypothetical protein